MNLTKDEKDALAPIVARVATLNADIQAAKWTIKEIAESAWAKCGVKPKVVKQLAKESAWDDVKRTEHRQYEESLDVCRAALGMLADLPLGQAALGDGDGGADEPQHHMANPLHKANGNDANGHVQAEPRRRGRPKGSRNKPKTEDWARPPAPVVPLEHPAAASPPQVPDFPDAA